VLTTCSADGTVKLWPCADGPMAPDPMAVHEAGPPLTSVVAVPWPDGTLRTVVGSVLGCLTEVRFGRPGAAGDAESVGRAPGWAPGSGTAVVGSLRLGQGPLAAVTCLRLVMLEPGAGCDGPPRIMCLCGGDDGSLCVFLLPNLGEAAVGVRPGPVLRASAHRGAVMALDAACDAGRVSGGTPTWVMASPRPGVGPAAEGVVWTSGQDGAVRSHRLRVRPPMPGAEAGGWRLACTREALVDGAHSHGAVTGVAVLPGALTATCGRDGALRLWTTSQGEERSARPHRDGPLRLVASSGPGRGGPIVGLTSCVLPRGEACTAVLVAHGSGGVAWSWSLPREAGEAVAAAASASLSAAAPSAGLLSDESLLAAVRRAVRLRTVTSRPADCSRCASYLATLAERLGAAATIEHVALPGAESNPIVTAVFAPGAGARCAARGAAGGKASSACRDDECCEQDDGPNPVAGVSVGVASALPLLLQGHYDVHPAPVRDWAAAGWRSDPFECRSEDGRLWGRGTADNKGPGVALLFAGARAARAAGRSFRGCVVVLEGNGEGGRGLDAWVATSAGRAWLSGLVDGGRFGGVVNSNGLWLDHEQPCVCVGTRGHTVLEVVVEAAGSAGPLHSGVDGDMARPQPVVELCSVVSALQLDRAEAPMGALLGAVAVPRWLLPCCPPLTAAEDALVSRVGEDGPSLGLYASHKGVVLQPGETAWAFFARRWFLPASTVHGVAPVGEAETSVQPRGARATISVRTPARSDPASLAASLEAEARAHHADKHPGSPHTLTVRQTAAARGWEGGESDLSAAARAAVDTAWVSAGRAVLTVRDGGTVRVLPALQAATGAPATLLCFAPADSNPHLADESIPVEALLRGCAAVEALLVGPATA